MHGGRHAYNSVWRKQQCQLCQAAWRQPSLPALSLEFKSLVCQAYQNVKKEPDPRGLEEELIKLSRALESGEKNGGDYNSPSVTAPRIPLSSNCSNRGIHQGIPCNSPPSPYLLERWKNSIRSAVGNPSFFSSLCSHGILLGEYSIECPITDTLVLVFRSTVYCGNERERVKKSLSPIHKALQMLFSHYPNR